MSDLTLEAFVIPSGSAIRLAIGPDDFVGTMTLTRAPSDGTSPTGAFVQLYSGPLIPIYIDPGDGLKAPLNATIFYIYKLTDGTTTVQTDPIQPVLQLNVELDQFLSMMIKLIQGGMSNVLPPDGPATSPVQVLQAMPNNGLPPVPSIAVNPDLVQQTNLGIGDAVPKYDESGNWTMNAMARYVLRISILTTDAGDRDYYRDAAMGICRSLTSSVLNYLGRNNHNDIQASSGQVAEAGKGLGPGFYYADVMFRFEGEWNITITPDFGIIAHIITTEHYPDGNSDTQEVP